MTYAKALYHDARDCSSDSGHTPGFVSGCRPAVTGGSVAQRVLSYREVCAGDVFRMSQTGSGDLGLRRADPVVLVFLR
jgi:hypothetical protein